MFILVIHDLVYTVLVARPFFDERIQQLGPYSNSHDLSPMYCYNVRENSTTDEMFPADYYFLWLIFPQILNGLAQLLVNMTVLEFICAQAPRTMQGLLIGIWYAMFSIRYLLMCSLDHVFNSSLGMLAYQAVRTGFILLSLILYMCVSRAYKYRVRDWVVNVQQIVEDTIERRINQRENYYKQLSEKRILIRSHHEGKHYGSCSQPE